MEMAERVEASPLFGTEPLMYEVTLTVDLKTEVVVDASAELGDQDPDQWELLLTRERALVFNEDDSVHITKLAAAIGREHEGLRPLTSVLGQQYRKWKDWMAFGVVQWTTSTPEAIPSVAELAEEARQQLNSAEMTTDLALTKLYANALLWHSDPDKIAVWNKMPPQLKDAARKAAEGRAITAAKLVHIVAEAIRSCRVAGYDF